MVHIPVWINKEKNFGREHTQRTRSFLYSALGTVVAHSIRAKGVRFFENGIVSLNLPVADEVLRARASRTTHPQALALFSRLYSLVLERSLEVDNPFLYKTKTEVVSLIAENDAAPLISLTCSCAHAFFKSKTQWHCGTCSQCIDRRIAVVAACQTQHDPETDYASDVFIGPRRKGQEQNMAVDYVRHALELDRMSETEIAERFGLEIPRAIRYEQNRTEAAEKLITMHKRHGEAVQKVLNRQLQEYIDQLLTGELENTSLLAMIAGRNHVISSWKRFADRILELLVRGVPIACQSVKPRNEPHLQEICDGILQAQENDLIREFPFMRWSASATKPDWSVEELLLWVEMKYVREKKDIRTITEDIAADITKYGDNRRRMLYVIYDPEHLVTDESRFATPIEERSNMLVGFIR
ncbi:MAG: 7-cyano-7-deazaguanine synthase [Chloroflexi bacterium]|nr:7-cyano-7-deazaguanine synthase [Chloroflexota bacterium]